MGTIISEISENETSAMHLIKLYSLKIKCLNDKCEVNDGIVVVVPTLNTLDTNIVDNRCVSMTSSVVLRIKKLLGETTTIFFRAEANE